MCDTHVVCMCCGHSLRLCATKSINVCLFSFVRQTRCVYMWRPRFEVICVTKSITVCLLSYVRHTYCPYVWQLQFKVMCATELMYYVWTHVVYMCGNYILKEYVGTENIQMCQKFFPKLLTFFLVTHIVSMFGT